MSTGIVKIKDRYFEWSTFSDSPTTPGLTRAEMRDYISTTYGTKGLEGLSRSVARADEFGSNYPQCQSLQEVIASNRAGEGGKRLTAEQIYERYEKGKPANFAPPSDDGKANLLKEYKAAKNMLARLGNAVAAAKKAPAYDGKAELLRCLDDLRRLAEKLHDSLAKDKETYGL